MSIVMLMHSTALVHSVDVQNKVVVSSVTLTLSQNLGLRWSCISGGEYLSFIFERGSRIRFGERTAITMAV